MPHLRRTRSKAFWNARPESSAGRSQKFSALRPSSRPAIRNGGGAALHDAPHGLLQQTIRSLLRPVVAEKKRIPGLAFGELLAQQFIDVAVGQFARFARTVEEVDDPLLLRGKAGNRGLKVIRPTRGRAQQPLGKRIVAVDAREEPCADRSPHRAAEHRVDHRVEDDVVDRADSGKEPGVTQDHVVKLVQDEEK